MSGRQLTLNVLLDDEATFDTFFVSADSPNALALQSLTSWLAFNSADPFVYLWGAPGCGLSHLLQAACHEAERAGRRSQYLPLKELGSAAPTGVFEALEQFDLVCLDDISAVLGKPAWEEALFHLFNRLREHGCRLLVSAASAPRDLPCQLPDLASRLAWGTVFRVEALTDEEKQKALQLRAHSFGLELGDEAARFLLHHTGRDTHSLFAALRTLDRVSLAEKRKLSIPLIKEALGL